MPSHQNALRKQHAEVEEDNNYRFIPTVENFTQKRPVGPPSTWFNDSDDVRKAKMDKAANLKKRKALNRTQRAMCRIVAAHGWKAPDIAYVFNVSLEPVRRALVNNERYCKRPPPDDVAMDYDVVDDEFALTYPPIPPGTPAPPKAPPARNPKRSYAHYGGQSGVSAFLLHVEPQYGTSPFRDQCAPELFPESPVPTPSDMSVAVRPTLTADQPKTNNPEPFYFIPLMLRPPRPPTERISYRGDSDSDTERERRAAASPSTSGPTPAPPWLSGPSPTAPSWLSTPSPAASAPSWLSVASPAPVTYTPSWVRRRSPSPAPTRERTRNDSGRGTRSPSPPRKRPPTPDIPPWVTNTSQDHAQEMAKLWGR
ncbi:hypothetical protein MKEN_00712200 [Mycena kentingensis (nom. inval.)]|nr:hypothetical protein MKEN_00712200 [Mycena kentingensis (nom. inval.)]